MSWRKKDPLILAAFLSKMNGFQYAGTDLDGGESKHRGSKVSAPSQVDTSSSAPGLSAASPLENQSTLDSLFPTWLVFVEHE